MRYYGCPAEEGGAAKAFMVRAGAFADVDIAITWHPAAMTGVDEALSLANTRMDFTFTGRASHAAAAPHLGRSALDAVELMNVGVNYMREHVPSDSRIHYAMIDAGGIAPNVVQAKATVRYAVRSRDVAGHARAERAGAARSPQGAALMTETQVEIKVSERGLQSARQHAAGGGHVSEPAAPRPGAVRRRRPRIRRQDPGDAVSEEDIDASYAPRRRRAQGRERRCAISSCRWR